MTHPAKWWHPHKNDKILCTLCPRYCQIGDNQSGFCYIRKNVSGQLYSLGYGHPTGFAVDPIEKKPLFHFLPGSDILSFGTAGCNLGCKFCQNWSMSKAKSDDVQSVSATPEQVVELAKQNSIPSIAFTYNDPIIFGEYVMDISEMAKQEKINSVMVTNGYIDSSARSDVFANISAANVDLKSFDENFYYRLTGAHLQPVLDTLNWIKNETDIWLEITTLLIPGENDSEEEIKRLTEWILGNLGDSIPLHFSAFHPAFRMQNYSHTPPNILVKARNIAQSAGVKYCYLGNVHTTDGQTTFCPNCKTSLIHRDWHKVHVNNVHEGECAECGYAIAGHWK